MPFSTVADGDTFYVAIHACKEIENELPKVVASIPPLLTHLTKFRMMVMLFGRRLEEIRIYDQDSVFDVIDFPLNSNGWQEGSGVGDSIDLPLNIAHADHLTISRKRPQIFIYTRRCLSSYWNPTNLALAMDVTWLGAHGLSKVGIGKYLNFDAIALTTLKAAIKPFDLPVPSMLKDDATAGMIGPAWVDYKHFRAAAKAANIARILTESEK